MPDIDEFASSLLEEAKRFLEKAQAAAENSEISPYCHAAIMLAFCSLEAHVNSVADDFSADSLDLTPHELAILKEQDVVFDKGEFVLKGSLKIYRLKDRILFLHKRFGRKPFDDKAAWQANLAHALNLRNRLTHPKAVPHFNIADVERIISAIIETLAALYLAVYKKRFPAARRGLQSKLTF